MARSAEEMVQVPADLLRQLQARLESLEHAERVRIEQTDPRQRVEDEAWERRKALLSRSPEVKTQEAADRQYGTAAPRWRVCLDSTQPDGRKGPNISEHFPLVLSANSDLEAQARYLNLMHITKHDYALRCEAVA